MDSRDSEYLEFGNICWYNEYKMALNCQEILEKEGEKMKKSLISLLLAVCMVFSLSINVLAYEMNSWCWYKSHNENDGRIMEELSGEAAHPMSVHICPVVNGEPDRTNIILPKIQNVKVFNELDEDVTSCFQFENHSKNNGLPTLIIVPDQEMQGDYTIIYVDEELNINLSLPLIVEPYVETVTEGYAWIDEDGNEVTVINAFVGEPVSVRFKNLSSGEIVHLDGKSANGVEGAVIREYDSETKTITYTFTTTELHDGKNIFTVIATHTEGIWIEFPLTIVVSEKDAALGWLYWDFTDSVRITGYDGELSGEIVVPSEINGKKVTMFQAHSQYNNASQVIKITLPEGVTYIEGDFGQFSALTEINLPESITQLALIFDCPSLKTINYAGTEAQWNSIRKHESMSLDGITLNFGKEMTNKWLCWNNTDSATVAIIGYEGKLSGEVIVPSEIDGKKVTEFISQGQYNGMKQVTKITIPEGVTYIEGNFGSFTALTEINLPESLTQLNLDITCPNLKTINYAGTEAQWNTINYDNYQLPENVTLNFGKESTNEWTYKPNGGSANLTGFDGILEGEVTIPSEIDGRKVCCLDSRALAGQSQIKKIIIPDGLSWISYGAFTNCTNLEEITIPESITSISSCFAGCANLKVINFAGTKTQWHTINRDNNSIPENVIVNFGKETTTWWAYADSKYRDGTIVLTGYYGGELTGEVIIPAVVDGHDVYGLEWNALKNQTAITKVVLEEGIEYIGAYAFSGCTALEEIDIPVTFYNYGMQIFDGCTNLKTINYRGTETEWNSVHITDLVTIPENITINFLGEVSNQWLYRENGDGTLTLTGFDGVLEGEVIIPSEIDGKTVNRIDGRRNENGRYVDTFEGQDNITSIVIPDTVLEINNIADGNQALQSVTIPSSVQRVWSGDNPFQNCAALENFILTGENHAFRFENGMLSYKEHLVHCVNSVSGVCEIPKGITFIHHQAFSSCDKLTHIVFPEGLTQIWSNWGIDESTGLTAVTIPVSVTEIAPRAFFSGMTGPLQLTDVYYNGTEEQWKTIEIGENNENILNANIHFSEEPVYETGDPNGDNEINSADVNLLYRAVMDYANLTDAQASAADVNHDGSINSADVNLLYRYVMSYVQNLAA